MALLALSAPTGFVADPALTAGVQHPSSESGVMSGNTAFTFVNQPAGIVIVRFVVGTGGTGTIQFMVQNTKLLAQPAAVNITAGNAYLFGPFDTNIFSNNKALVLANVTGTQTNNTVGVYKMAIPGNPSATVCTSVFRPTHNPFEPTEGASDW